MTKKSEGGRTNLALWISIISLIIVLILTLFAFTLLELPDKSEQEKRIERLVNEAIDKRLRALDNFLIKKYGPEGSLRNQVPGKPEAHPVKFLKITSPADGAEISNNVIVIQGKHSLPLYSHVWLIFEDSNGNYYVQHPPLLLREDGTFTASDISLGDGITEIIALEVDANGNNELENIIKEGQWGAIKDLPANSKIWDDIRISINR